jgi:ATP-dependent Clp protease ATP-binding subunit ClpX
MPVIAAIHQLTREDLIRILTEPRNALARQFRRFFEFDDIDLVFAPDSLGAIADRALERETGARGLRSILEDTLMDVQFELPSRSDVTKCVVTKETIEKGQRPMLVTDATGEHDVVEPDEELGEQTA